MCVKVKVYEGVFPLRLHPEKANSLPVPAGAEEANMEELETSIEEEESKGWPCRPNGCSIFDKRTN